MTRRDAIKRTTFIMGASLSAATLTGILSGCQPEPTGIDWQPTAFNKEQGQIIAEIANQIIPTTDTPGAIDVGVHTFIDGLVGDYYDAEHKKSFMDGLGKFIESAAASGKSFLSMSDQEKVAFLTTVDKHAHEYMEDENPDGIDRPFWTKMKEMTLTGFFLSEVGATEVLQYEHIPGKYAGCVSLEEAGGRGYAVR